MRRHRGKGTFPGNLRSILWGKERRGIIEIRSGGGENRNNLWEEFFSANHKKKGSSRGTHGKLSKHRIRGGSETEISTILLRGKKGNGSALKQAG